MRGWALFLIILAIVGVAGWFIITTFALPQPALVIFGLFLLAALVVKLFDSEGKIFPS